MINTDFFPGSRNRDSPQQSKRQDCTAGRFSNFKMEFSSQINKCSLWLCKRTHANHLSEHQRSSSADMIHKSVNNANLVGLTSVDDDTQPPARNCHRLIVLG